MQLSRSARPDISARSVAPWLFLVGLLTPTLFPVSAQNSRYGPPAVSVENDDAGASIAQVTRLRARIYPLRPISPLEAEIPPVTVAECTALTQQLPRLTLAPVAPPIEELPGTTVAEATALAVALPVLPPPDIAAPPAEPNPAVVVAQSQSAVDRVETNSDSPILRNVVAETASAPAATPTSEPIQPAEAAPSATTTIRSTDEPPVLAASAPPSGQLPTAAQIEAAGLASASTSRASADPNGAQTLVARTERAAHAAHTPHPPKHDVSLIGQRTIGNGVNFYSLDREMALGRELSQEVEATSKILTDPLIAEYVNRIGQNIVRNSDARVPFTIKVLDNDEVNAFALPGGFFYVDSGLILAADNEAELAGVMAHEIAHVAARHATKNMTKAQIWNMASIPLMFIGGPAAYAISEVASIAVPLSFLKFSRDAEREADVLGLQYDYMSGYDPQAFVQFFEKLNVEEKKKHSKLAKMFSTHPMNADRIAAAQDEIRKYLPDRDNYVVDTSEFAEVKVHLLALQNANHLHGPQGSNRPILLKRTGAETNADPDPSAESKASSPPPDKSDDGRPTLKRQPAN